MAEKNVQFTWAGGGQELEKYRDFVKENEQINFEGETNSIGDLFAKADIYFQPSKWESQGLAVAEAMSFGLACVVTKNGGTAEMVEEGVNGYHVDPDNVDECIAKLEKLVGDERVRTEMGKASRERYEREYSKKNWYLKMDQMMFH